MRAEDGIVESLFQHYVLLGPSEIGTRVSKLSLISVGELVGMLEVAFVAGAVTEISDSLRQVARQIFEVFGNRLNEYNYRLPQLFRARVFNERDIRVRTDHRRQFSNFLALTWEWELEDATVRRLQLLWAQALEDPALHERILADALSTPESLALSLAHPRELTVAHPRELTLRTNGFVDDVLRVLQFVWALNGVFEESESEFNLVAWNYHSRLFKRPGLSTALLETSRRLASWAVVGQALVRAVEDVCGLEAQGRYFITPGATG